MIRACANLAVRDFQRYVILHRESEPPDTEEPQSTEASAVLVRPLKSKAQNIIRYCILAVWRRQCGYAFFHN